jgi:hypothetical protein
MLNPGLIGTGRLSGRGASTSLVFIEIECFQQTDSSRSGNNSLLTCYSVSHFVSQHLRCNLHPIRPRRPHLSIQLPRRRSPTLLPVSFLILCRPRSSSCLYLLTSCCIFSHFCVNRILQRAILYTFWNLTMVLDGSKCPTPEELGLMGSSRHPISNSEEGQPRLPIILKVLGNMVRKFIDPFLLNGVEHVATVRALYQYEARGSDELELREGELIELSTGPSGGQNYGEGWWEGKISVQRFFGAKSEVPPAGYDSSGRKGIFPSNYVRTQNLYYCFRLVSDWVGNGCLGSTGVIYFCSLQSRIQSFRFIRDLR